MLPLKMRMSWMAVRVRGLGVDLRLLDVEGGPPEARKEQAKVRLLRRLKVKIVEECMMVEISMLFVNDNVLYENFMSLKMGYVASYILDQIPCKSSIMVTWAGDPTGS